MNWKDFDHKFLAYDEKTDSFSGSQSVDDFVKEIDRGGYDGIIIKRDLRAKAWEAKADQFVVFKPTQIKSATGNDGTWDSDDPDIRSNPPLRWKKLKSYETAYGDFEEYFLDGDNRNGIMTVEIDKRNGYRLRNIFVEDHLKRQGYATDGYESANAESLRRTGKPLRSSEIGYQRKNSETSMSPDAQALWESFVEGGMAACFYG